MFPRSIGRSIAWLLSAVVLLAAYFAWNSWDASLGPDDLFFFRIQSPVVIIEFDHQGTIGIPGEPRDIPIRQHVHSIVRTPNGNDYGMDLLRQHYAQNPH